MDGKPANPKAAVMLLKAREPAEHDLESWREETRKQNCHCVLLDLATPQESSHDSDEPVPGVRRISAAGEGMTNMGTDRPQEGEPDEAATPEEEIERNAYSDIKDFLGRAASGMGREHVVLLAGGFAARLAVAYMLRQKEESSKKPASPPGPLESGIEGTGNEPADGSLSNVRDGMVSVFRSASEKRISAIAVCGLSSEELSSAKEELDTLLLAGPPEAEDVLEWIRTDFAEWLETIIVPAAGEN